MHRFLIIFLWLSGCYAFAQQKKPMPTYTRDWQQADSLVKKGLPKSALDVVERIAQRARADHNEPQQVKVAMFRLTHQPYTNEDVVAQQIEQLRRDVAAAAVPARNILQSILAETYWTYYQQNRWKFANRQTDDQPSTDPRTWSLARLTTETVATFEASLAQPDLLRKTPIETFDVILHKGDADGRAFRPTLYDFLAHRALAFYQNTEPDLTRPANRFALDRATYLADADTFVKQKLVSSDTLSLKFRALQLYQDLLAWQAPANASGPRNARAHASLDVQRLAFVHQYSTLPDRDTVYQQTLERAIDRHKQQPAEVFYGLALAEHWASLGNQDKPGDWRRKAADLATSLLRRFPKAGTETTNLQRLLERLSIKMLTLTLEEGNAPNAPIRALVSFRNVPTLHYRIVRVGGQELKLLEGWYNGEYKQMIQYYLHRAVVKQGYISLPDDGDRQDHRTEVALPALPLGHYVVLTAPSAQFTDTTSELAVTRLTVTNLGYLIGQKPVAAQKVGINVASDFYPDDNGEAKLYVLNRQSGQPLAGTKVELVEQYYTNNQLKQRNVGLFRTDANGALLLPKSTLTQSRTYRFRIITKGDTLLTEPVYQSPPQPRTNTAYEERMRSLLFTDRAIYRPGQPIFFKAVVYRGKTNEFRVLDNTAVDVVLSDVNGKEVAKMSLKTNTFGTVDGQFTAPTGRLTGNMLIRIGDQTTSIRVEEYKRPTFEVTVDPVKGSYKLGQSVRVQAVAKTYAGAVVDGASVRYRIVRRQQPRWFWWDGGDYLPTSRRMPGRTPETEIGSGVLTTDATGAVSLTFVAAPDALVDRSTNPIFNFTVSFDVTDATGETRSAAETLGIGYSALTATLDLPAELPNQPRKVALRVNNASGERVPVSGQLTLSPLQPPAQPLRKRIWQTPDRFALSRDAFKKLFPNDVYADEDQLPNWPKGKPVDVVPINQTDTLSLDLSRYAAGTYAAELRVTDASGESVTLTQYVTITTEQQPIVNNRPDAWVSSPTTEFKPGEVAAFLVSDGGWGSGKALMRVLQNGQIQEERWLTLGPKPLRIPFPVTKARIGSFAVSFTRIRDGRLYDVSKPVLVPVPDKSLRIETLTFRDQLKPGQPEQWTLRISGPAQDKLLAQKGFAELVATLYDASLDAFVPLNWPRSPYVTMYPYPPGWKATAFKSEASRELNWQHAETSSVARQFDRLIWLEDGPGFGFSRAGLDKVVRVGYGQRREITGAVAPMASKQSMSVSVSLKHSFSADEAAKDQREGYAYLGLNDSGTSEGSADAPVAVDPRRNFNETAFFFPKLQTDEQGRVLLNFTMPDALTRWRLLAFAHTPDLKTGSLERTVVTQKELMVSLNTTRFMREGDTLRITARLNNLTDKALTGSVRIDAIDPATGKPLTTLWTDKTTSQSFQMAARQSAGAGWTLVVPTGLENVAFRVSAQSGDFTDAEERVVPVLPNRMLVLDSQPFYVNGSETKEIRLKALTSQNPELPSQAERLTVELTSNPVWTALQSLPYLAEFPYECAEQLFSRVYANALANHIVNARPDIRAVAEGWAKQALPNPLETNPELKSVTLDETPWRRDARNQQEQQAQLGRFLQDESLQAGQRVSLEKLRQLQMTGGGFAWFAGMPVDQTISLHVLTGFGHLAKLGITWLDDQREPVQNIQAQALRYVDEQAQQWVDRQKRAEKPEAMSFWPVQYLYARSFYPDKPINEAVQQYIREKITKNWLDHGLYEQAQIALTLHRLGDRKTPAAILKSLKERAATSDELGMYWPANRAGFYWQQAPIETQALLIEAFSEIASDQAAVDAMRKWLLSQKRTSAWPSTKSTTEAIYALLLNGDDWLNTSPGVTLRVGGQPVETAVNGPMGYQKITYLPADIKPEMGVVTVSKTTKGPAWGGIYYQHFEPLDRVTPSSAQKAAAGNMTVTKQLFVLNDGPTMPVGQPITEKTGLKPGDRVRVRLEVRSDRDMQYVHLKDSRAAGFEPTAEAGRAVLSGYRFQNGLGYYEAPRDASTDFYLQRLPAGTHVFEYDLRVVHAGDFSTGVATVQCFYAPEFSARSIGNRVRVNVP